MRDSGFDVEVRGGMPPFPPGGDTSDEWLRWRAFEVDIVVHLGLVDSGVMGSTPLIQLVRSLDWALSRCLRLGRSEWDIYDVGASFSLRLKGENIEITLPGGDVSCDVSEQAVTQAISGLRQVLIEAARVEGPSIEQTCLALSYAGE